MHYYPCPTPHELIHEFDVRLIVAGSRYYDDYQQFSETMAKHIKQYGDKSIIFISGKASTGADALIIQWCIEHRLPWAEFPANWDLHKKSAGYIRNTEMANVATDLIVFYDGVSRGTGHMLDIAKSRNLGITNVLITIKEN